MDINEVTQMVEQGHTIRMIGEELNTSPTNVRYWLKKFGLKTSRKKQVKKAVGARRRKVKAILVEEAGGVCLDCGYVGPPFMFDFDHRDPTTKELRISSGDTIAIARLREEVKKCDLVCARCHRMRTHKQRCVGCDYCI